MPLLKRRTKRKAEIPSASMADVAFLLLIFFLVTTTINVESGIFLQLPPKPDPANPPPDINDRNLLTILVASNGDVLVENELSSVSELRNQVKQFVTNEGRDPSLSDGPDEAVVSFKAERALPYEQYINVLDEIKAAYIEIRNGYARQLAGVDYATYRAQLPEGAEDEVSDRYPQKISLAEPDAGGGGGARAAGG
jgi:biopolymer transport protein ExbD